MVAQVPRWSKSHILFRGHIFASCTASQGFIVVCTKCSQVWGLACTLLAVSPFPSLYLADADVWLRRSSPPCQHSAPATYIFISTPYVLTTFAQFGIGQKCNRHSNWYRNYSDWEEMFSAISYFLRRHATLMHPADVPARNFNELTAMITTVWFAAEI